MENVLWIYVVYASPSDYPGKFVVKRQYGGADGRVYAEANPLMVEEEYEPIREEMQKIGLVKLDRYPGDDPIIMETWL